MKTTVELADGRTLESSPGDALWVKKAYCARCDEELDATRPDGSGHYCVHNMVICHAPRHRFTCEPRGSVFRILGYDKDFKAIESYVGEVVAFQDMERPQ